jgi:hypothetical protein
VTYQWQVVTAPAGSSYTLNGSASAIATFYSTTTGVFEVLLTVRDGLATDTDVVQIVVAPNQSPVADASRSEEQVNFGSSARLDATLSSDPDDVSLTYKWRVVASSNNSTPVITSSTSPIAFLQPTMPGVYAVELKVSDGASSDTDYVLITVVGNQAPVADASASDSVVIQGTLPRLDASRSLDPDGDQLVYQWTVVASSTGQLPLVTSTDAVLTTLQAEEVGSYAVQLTVSDGDAVATDFIVITVNAQESFDHAWTGDFDGNGWVDPADYVMWRDKKGATVEPFESADATGDGTINQQDYQIWSANYGLNSGSNAGGVLGTSSLIERANAETAATDSIESPTVNPDFTSTHFISRRPFDDHSRLLLPLLAREAPEIAKDRAMLLLMDSPSTISASKTLATRATRRNESTVERDNDVQLIDEAFAKLTELFPSLE